MYIQHPNDEASKLRARVKELEALVAAELRENARLKAENADLQKRAEELENA